MSQSAPMTVRATRLGDANVNLAVQEQRLNIVNERLQSLRQRLGLPADPVPSDGPSSFRFRPLDRASAPGMVLADDESTTFSVLDRLDDTIRRVSLVASRLEEVSASLEGLA